MNKFERAIKNSVNKLKLMSIVCVAVIIVGLIAALIFGVNNDITFDHTKTVTVQINQYAYATKLDEIESVCEDVFTECGVKYAYQQKGEMNGDDSEIVYVFNTSVDVTEAVEKLDAAFDQATTSGSLQGSFISVVGAQERVVDRLADEYLLTTVLAGVLFGVLAGGYIVLRHNFAAGFSLALTMCLSAGLTSAVCVLTRLPISISIVYVLFFDLLFTAIATMLTYNKIHDATKSAEKGANTEEIVVSNLSNKAIVIFASAVAIAWVVVGAIATHTVRMFCIFGLLATISGTFAALFFAPASYLFFKNIADKKAAEKARYDYKKGE